MIKIISVGDIFPGNMPYTKGFGVLTKSNRGIDFIQNLRPLFSDTDIFFGNLESPLPGEYSDIKKKVFAGETRFLDKLKFSSTSILSLANNHILEHGKIGFEKTVKALTNYGILPIGVKNDNGKNFVIIEKKGLKIGFASFNGINDIPNPDCYTELIKSEIVETLRSMVCDIKIVSLHWGEEYMHSPSPEQVKLGRELIDAGANIIIGHHPHVIQNIENYNNGLIFYSLGNFIFDMHWSESTRVGMVAEIVVEDNGEVSYHPHFVRINRNYCPVLLKKNSRYIDIVNKPIEYNFSNHSLVEIQQQNYMTIATRVRNRHRVLSKLFWLLNIYRQSPENWILLLKNGILKHVLRKKK